MIAIHSDLRIIPAVLVSARRRKWFAEVAVRHRLDNPEMTKLSGIGYSTDGGLSLDVANVWTVHHNTVVWRVRNDRSSANVV